MSDVQRVVELIFRATDRVSAPLRGIGRAADAASRGLRTAAAGAGRSFSDLAATIHHVGGALRTFQMIGAPVIDAVKTGVFDLNSSFEDTQKRVAGALQAFGLVSTFEDGQKAASKAFAKIQAQAAALPGELEDYLAVFEMGLPKVIEAGITDVEKIADVTNRFGAVAISQGLDATQAASDAMRLLGGQAGMDVRMWTALAPLIGKSAQEFNKLSATDRLKAVEGVLGKYDDLLSAYGDSMSSVQGTLKTQVKDFTRIATKPLFDRAKSGMIELTSMIADNGPAMQRIADSVGGALVAGIDAAVRAFSVLRDVAEDVLGTLGRAADKLGVMAAAKRVAGAVSGVASSVGAEDPLGALTAVLTRSPSMVAMVSMFQQLATHGDVLSGVLSGVATIAENLLGAFGPVLEVATMLGAIVGDVVAAVLPPLVSGLVAVSDGIGGFVESVASGLEVFLERARPTMVKIGEVVGKIAEIIGRVLKPTLKALGWVFEQFVAGWNQYVAPIIDAIVWLLGKLADGILWVLDKIPGFESGAQPRRAASAPFNPSSSADPFAGKPAGYGGFQAPTKIGYGVALGSKLAAKAAAEAVARKPPSSRPSGKTVFDFRNSRFDIQQEYAEGFDPDRVAVAFSQDLARLGELRVQSGYAPLFGV